MQRENDQLLFSADKLEGEFTRWEFVYFINFTPRILLGSMVLNNGEAGALDNVLDRIYHISRAGVVTTLLNRTLVYTTPFYSLQRKYVAAKIIPVPSRTLEIYRNGVLDYTLNMTPNVPLNSDLRFWDFSPDGRYITAILREAPPWLNNRYLVLYQGFS